MTRTLGKLPKQDDPRNLRLARYVDRSRLRPIGVSKAWGTNQRWPMLANDRVGCCVFAAQGHATQVWTAAGGRPCVVSETDVLSAYAAVSGYDGTPATDTGATMLAGLKHWRSHGIGGHTILAFAEVDPRDHATVSVALDVFGGLYVGAMLPSSAKHEEVWQFTGGEPGTWGGHAMWCTGRGPSARRLTTWGHDQDCTPEFWDRYVDECYAVISEEFLGADLRTPHGLRLDELLADLRVVTA